MNLSLVIPWENSLHFASYQFGFLTREWYFNMTLKCPVEGVVIKYLYFFIILYLKQGSQYFSQLSEESEHLIFHRKTTHPCQSEAKLNNLRGPHLDCRA